MAMPMFLEKPNATMEAALPMQPKMMTGRRPIRSDIHPQTGLQQTNGHGKSQQQEMKEINPDVKNQGARGNARTKGPGHVMNTKQHAYNTTLGDFVREKKVIEPTRRKWSASECEAGEGGGVEDERRTAEKSTGVGDPS